MGLHPTGDIDSIAPKVINELLASDNSGDYRAATHADAHAEREQRRLEDKDALDILRLLQATETTALEGTIEGVSVGMAVWIVGVGSGVGVGVGTGST